jgi:hypothetical protein
MKKIILALWIAYIFMLVADYMATVKHADREFCQRWFDRVPVYFHVLIPGPGNACFDMGLWP